MRHWYHHATCAIDVLTGIVVGIAAADGCVGALCRAIRSSARRLACLVLYRKPELLRLRPRSWMDSVASPRSAGGYRDVVYLVAFRNVPLLQLARNSAKHVFMSRQTP